MSDDDFDVDDFDYEEDTSVPVTPQSIQFTRELPSYLQFSTISEHVQNPFSYQKQLNQLIIREQFISVSSQQVDAQQQTYQEPNSLEKQSQTNEISGFSSALLLRTLTASSAVVGEFDTVKQFLEKTVTGNKQTLKKLKLLKQIQNLYLVELLLAGGSQEASSTPTLQIAEPLNSFAQAQTVLVQLLQNPKILRSHQISDFVLKDKLYVLLRSGRLLELNSDLEIIGDLKFQVDHVVAGNSGVFAVGQQRLFSFNGLQSYEMVQTQVYKLFVICGMLFGVDKKGIIAIESLADVQKGKYVVLLSEIVNQIVEKEGKVEVLFQSGKNEVWSLGKNQEFVVDSME